MKYNSELSIKEKVNIMLTLYKEMRNNLYQAEVDEYNSISFGIDANENDTPVKYSIELNPDYTAILYRDYETISLSDTLYGVLKDMFIPLRNRIYEINDNANKVEEEEIDYFEDDLLKDCNDPHYYDEIGLNFA